MKKGIYLKRIRFSRGLNPDALAAQLAQSLHPKDWVARYPCKLGNKENVRLLLHCLLTSPFPTVAVKRGSFFRLADFSYNFITQPLGLLMQPGALCFQRVIAVKLRLRCYPAIYYHTLAFIAIHDLTSIQILPTKR